MTETEAAEEFDHALDKPPPLATYESQLPAQRRCGEGYQRWVNRALLFLCGEGVVEAEVLEIREESDQIKDLMARTVGFI